MKRIRSVIRCAAAAFLALALGAALYGCAGRTVSPQSGEVSSSAAPSSSGQSSAGGGSVQVQKVSSAPSPSSPSSGAAGDSDKEKTVGDSDKGKTDGQSGAPSKGTTVPKETDFVFLTIDERKGGGDLVAENAKIQLQSGDTAFTVLERYCKQNNMLLAKQATKQNGKPDKIFVTSIDGVSMSGGEKGWLYRINTEFPSDDCNRNPLKNGDRVLWIYTIDLGKSEGARK